MKKITIQSGKFYVAVPHSAGEALFEFDTEDDQNSFIQELEVRGDTPSALSPLQIKIGVHKQLSIKSPLGLPLFIVKNFIKDGRLTDGLPCVWKYQYQLNNGIKEMAPYLQNKHGYSAEDNLEVVIREQVILANKWYSRSLSKLDTYVSYSSYVRGVLDRILDKSLLPPSKAKPIKK